MCCLGNNLNYHLKNENERIGVVKNIMVGVKYWNIENKYHTM